MKFLVDECTGPAVADWLRHQNHEVLSVCCMTVPLSPTPDPLYSN